MKVLLLENVTNIWKKWDIKEVKPWYAANCLFPKKLAVELTPAEEQKLKAQLKKEEKHRLELLENRHSIVDSINWKTIKFEMKVSNSWKVFWWIGEHDIIIELKKQFKVDLAKKHIDMWPDWHIKKIWSRVIYIKLWSDAIAKVNVEVSWIK